MSGNPIVEVAAAVLLRDDAQEFLLAQRPPGKVYAGYWEFPGGKLEVGESIRDALVRELWEELGIRVTEATPWLVREFTYPHATVRLNFWRVTAWEGEIGITAPLEHSAVAWQRRGQAETVSPMLPANAPILKALALPDTLCITCIEENGEDAEMSRIEARLALGRPFIVQLRDKHLPYAERLWQADAMRALTADTPALLVINDDADMARQCRADGLHLSTGSLRQCTVRPDFHWVGASCHNADELALATQLGLDYVLLGSVLPTASHPGAPTLGWKHFARITAQTPIPVFALGGLGEAHRAQALASGAHGLAMMRNW